MAKQKRKLTAAGKAAKRRRREEFLTIFINGKQKHVRRPPMIDGVPVDEFIRQNAELSLSTRSHLPDFPPSALLCLPINSR